MKTDDPISESNSHLGESTWGLGGRRQVAPLGRWLISPEGLPDAAAELTHLAGEGPNSPLSIQPPSSRWTRLRPAQVSDWLSVPWPSSPTRPPPRPRHSTL